MAKASDALRLAMQYIDTPDKWVKGVTVRQGPNGPCYCAIGANTTAIQELKLPHKVAQEARAFLRNAACKRVGFTTSVSGYNDAPGTRHEDIIAVFTVAHRDALEAEAACDTP